MLARSFTLMFCHSAFILLLSVSAAVSVINYSLSFSEISQLFSLSPMLWGCISLGQGMKKFPFMSKNLNGNIHTDWDCFKDVDIRK